MSANITAARRAAFLRALAETGNVTVSAQGAKLVRSWVQWRRTIDPAFDAACRAAIAAAADRLAGATAAKPQPGWGTIDGAELVVRGAPGRRVQLRRARLHGWSPSVEARFLAVLAASCNVKAACAEIGLTQASAYYHRRQWPAFAARWAVAIEMGAVKLEAALIENACRALSGPADLPEDGLMPPMSVQQAIDLFRMNRRLIYAERYRRGEWV